MLSNPRAIIVENSFIEASKFKANVHLTFSSENVENVNVGYGVALPSYYETSHHIGLKGGQCHKQNT